MFPTECRSVDSSVLKRMLTTQAPATIAEAVPEFAAHGRMLPAIYLARHGETAWSLTGQHTGLTDLPLTERGERNARALGQRLRGLPFAQVFTSPLQRARRTCELAGMQPAAAVDPDLLEWNYG